MIRRTIFLSILMLTACGPQSSRDKPSLMMNCHKKRDQARVDSKREHIAKLEAIVPHKDATAEAREAIARVIADERKQLEEMELRRELCRDQPDVPF